MKKVLRRLFVAFWASCRLFERSVAFFLPLFTYWCLFVAFAYVLSSFCRLCVLLVAFSSGRSPFFAIVHLLVSFCRLCVRLVAFLSPLRASCRLFERSGAFFRHCSSVGVFLSPLRTSCRLSVACGCVLANFGSDWAPFFSIVHLLFSFCRPCVRLVAFSFIISPFWHLFEQSVSFSLPLWRFLYACSFFVNLLGDLTRFWCLCYYASVFLSSFYT